MISIEANRTRKITVEKFDLVDQERQNGHVHLMKDRIADKARKRSHESRSRTTENS